MARTYKKSKVRWYIPLAVIFITGVLGVQLLSLYNKLNSYKQVEQSLITELEDAKAYEQELKDYEAYTKTDEFVQNTARSKLGLVKENEIIFKEK